MEPWFFFFFHFLNIFFLRIGEGSASSITIGLYGKCPNDGFKECKWKRNEKQNENHAFSICLFLCFNLEGNQSESLFCARKLLKVKTLQSRNLKSLKSFLFDKVQYRHHCCCYYNLSISGAEIWHNRPVCLWQRATDTTSCPAEFPATQPTQTQTKELAGPLLPKRKALWWQTSEKD